MGQPVLNPLFGYLAQLEGQIARAEEAFGMTPMARHKLGSAAAAGSAAAPDLVDELKAARARRRGV